MEIKRECIPGKPRMKQQEGPSEIDVSRRNAAAGVFSALGLIALSSCVDNGESAIDESATSSNLTGSTFTWVDTMANLRVMAHPTTATSQIAVLEGYLGAHDGGGGVFCWDFNSTATDNGGTIIRPNNVGVGSAGRWRRLYSGWLNVKWFGAGLGAADDQPVIQAVINLAGAQGGGTVYLPAGTYKISNALTINALGVSAIGDVKLATNLKKAGIDSTIFSLGAPPITARSQISRSRCRAGPRAQDRRSCSPRVRPL